jgi:LEA14-like dessication related protein
MVKLKGGGNVKKKLALALVVLIIAAAGAGFYIFSEVQKRQALSDVEVSLVDVVVKDVGISTASLDIKLKFSNPNDVVATLDRATYSVYGNETYVGDGEILEKVDVPPRADKTVTTPFELSYIGAAQVVRDYLTQGGHITWKLKGVAYIDTPLGTLTVPFEVTVSK